MGACRAVNLFYCTALALLLAAGTAAAADNVATVSGNWESPGTWSAGVPASDHDVVIPSGITVTINGLATNAINSLSITGTLTHAANTTNEVHKLILDVADSVTIADGGKIDVTGKGYNDRNGVTYAYGDGAGGSHGGEGGNNSGATYGSIVAPTQLGRSGVGNQFSYYVTPGGGAIRLDVAGTLTCAGGTNIVADGMYPPGNLYRGGAGGSVWITANALAGAGIVSAAGGPGKSYTLSHNMHGGGGGRIAVVLGSDDFGGVTFSAPGGLKYGDDAANGAPGTVYRKGASGTYGALVVDTAGLTTTATTPLLTGTHRFDSITLTNYATVELVGNAVLDLSNNPQIRGDGGMQNIRSRLVIGRDSSAVVWPSPTVIGYTISQYGTNRWTIPTDVTLATNGVLTHEANTTSRSHVLNLVVASNLTIQAGGGIDVIGKGYNDRNGLTYALADGAGGSHGGDGGNNSGATYGSIVAPTQLGRSGVGNTDLRYYVTPGGGVVILTVSNTLTCAGGTNIVADGMYPPGYLYRGAAGGAVWITANALAGAGIVSAAGGPGLSYTLAHNMHGGGGGRIAVVLGTDNFGSVTFSAPGGLKYGNNAANGAAGTVYRQTASQAGGKGTVTINNSDIVTDARTQIPPATNAALEELRRATVIATNYGAVASTTNVTIGDLLIYTDCSWTLTNWTLYVDSREHSLEDLTVRGPGATNRVDHYEQVIWIGKPPGSMLVLR